jgi:hypothetical protein
VETIVDSREGLQVKKVDYVDKKKKLNNIILIEKFKRNQWFNYGALTVSFTGHSKFLNNDGNMSFDRRVFFKK